MLNTEGEGERPVHSTLGASSADRWINCPGSVALLKYVGLLEEEDEPDYRAEGTAAHEAAAHCLTEGLDAWEVAGSTFGGVEIDEFSATAIQVYLDECRAHIGSRHFIEYRISSPAHKLFYGTLDFGAIVGTTMFIRDYKHGEGVAVEVPENPQFLYYAYGLLQDHPEVTDVDIGVVQPRISWHPDGPVRTWAVPADWVRNWAATVLVPAMLRTEIDDHLDAGPWCRFCPAKLVCPLLTGLFKAAATANPKEIPNVSEEMLGFNYQYLAGVKQYIAALEDEVYRRLSNAKTVPNVKLVQKKANRVWKEGAEQILGQHFGAKIYGSPELLSPPSIEKLGPGAKELVKGWAYTPQSGLTVALASDPRVAVAVKPLSETFSAAVAEAIGVAN